ncbi:MAG: hypothetical protein IPP32_01325 [Bacteroidetes bacterium]|nr:hypothetical protein [Bacteroidota bacterium]
MNAKKLFLKSLLSLALVGAVFSGCKKDKTDEIDPDETSEQVVNASDERTISSEMEDSEDDANRLLLNYPHFRGLGWMATLNGNHIPCNSTVDTSLIGQGRLTITFNGNTCDNKRFRTGTITLQLPYNSTTNTVTPWSAAGSMLTVTFTNFKITRLSDNKSITFNGTKYITNVNGGLVDDATSFASPIVHHITGAMQITFDDGTTRSWNIDRTRSIARTNGVTTVTITGNSTQNGISNVSVWGVNRKGNTFTVSIPTAIVMTSTCDFHPISGVRVHTGVVRELTVTFGVDASGNPVTSGCPYGYRLNWENRRGVAKQAVVSY